MPKKSSSANILEAATAATASVASVTVVTSEDAPSPIHTKEFQNLSETPATVPDVGVESGAGAGVHMGAESLPGAELINSAESTILEAVEVIQEELLEYVDVPTDVHPLVEVSCGTSCLYVLFSAVFFPFPVKTGQIFQENAKILKNYSFLLYFKFSMTISLILIRFAKVFQLLMFFNSLKETI